MIVTNRGQWEEVVRNLEQSRDPRRGMPVIGADTETVDRGYPNISITGMSLAWYDGDTPTGCYVPFQHAGVEDQMDIEQVREDLIRLFDHPDRHVVFHNAKYDVKAFDCHGIDFGQSLLFDTMIAGFLLDTCGCGSKKQRMFDLGTFSLESYVEHIFDGEMGSLDDFCEKESKYPDTDINEDVYLTHEVDVETMAEYAIPDSVWALKLRDYELDHFSQENDGGRLWRIYEKVEEPFIMVLADMEEWGIEIVAEMLADMRDEMEEELDEIYHQMYEARPGQDFAPVDPELVKEATRRYRDLEERYELPKDHEDYPDHSEFESSSKSSGPVGKGWARKYMFKSLGLEGTPIEEKIRDAFDKTSPMDRHLEMWPHLAHKMFNHNSNRELNKVLFDEANLVPYGDKTKNGLWSTKKEYVKKWADKHEVAENLNRLRLVGDLKSTYAEGILARLSDDGRLRTRFNRIVRTGRLSSRDPNLQNQPKEEDYPIRAAFVGTGVSESEVEVLEVDDSGDPLSLVVRGEDGGYHIYNGRVDSWWGNNPPWVLGVGDYSQLEIRILAHFSQDDTLLTTLREGTDIHGKTAKMMFPDRIPDDVGPDQVKAQYPKVRDDVKPVEFGTIYGAGPAEVSRQLGIPKLRDNAGPEETSAEEIIDRFKHEIYPGVGKWIDKQHRFVRSHGYVYTYLGRKRHIPLAFISDTYENKKQLWRAQRIAQNSPIQGTAADIINTAMVKIRSFARRHNPSEADTTFLAPDTPVEHTQDFESPLWGEWMRMLLQIHDELVMEFHPAIANWAMDKTVGMMEDVVTLDVPLVVDAALGVDWHRTKE